MSERKPLENYSVGTIRNLQCVADPMEGDKVTGDLKMDFSDGEVLDGDPTVKLKLNGAVVATTTLPNGPIHDPAVPTYTWNFEFAGVVCGQAYKVEAVVPLMSQWTHSVPEVPVP